MSEQQQDLTRVHRVEHRRGGVFGRFSPTADTLCVGSGRRWFLSTGLAGLAGLSLPGLLQQRSLAAGTQAKTAADSVILIWLSGGPSQLDTWDPKPNAPREIRGPFGTISTALPGVQFSEHLPKQARMLDRFALIRSMDASASNHTPTTFQAANPKARRVADQAQNGGGFPSMGSVAAKFRGPNRPGVPPFVALADSMVSDVYGAGQLGHDYEPLDGMSSAGKFNVPTGIEPVRLDSRHNLRAQLDRFRRHVELTPGLELQDRYVQEAYDMVSSGDVARAFDVSQEPESVRERYGSSSFGKKALLARRLVEAGVTFITLSDAWGHWDHHGDDVRWGGIEKGLKPMLPGFDHGLTNLIEDLEQRGLLERTLVVVLGEFGRGPVINKQQGRDHWTPVMSMLLAGGGVPGGQVIGATDNRGGAIQERHLGPGDLAATVFHKLGIDPHDHWLHPSGRPIPLVEGDAAPIAELV